MAIGLRSGRTSALLLLIVLLAGAVGGLFLWLAGNIGEPPGAMGEPAGATGVPTAVDAGGATALPGPPPAAAGARDVAGERTALGAELERAEVPDLDWGGVVVDRSTGDPLPGTEVELSGGVTQRRAETGTDGRFRLPWPEGLAARLTLSHPGYVDLRRPEVDFASELEVEMARSGSIAGVLMDEGGNPVAAGDIRLWSWARTRYRDAPDAVTAADASGRFLFTDLDPGEHAVCVAREGAPLLYEPGIAVVSGERTELALTLDEGLALSGRVTIGDSALGVAGARVTVRPERQGTANDVEELAEHTVVTAANGTFAIPGLSAGANDIEIRVAWGARLGKRIELSVQSEHEEREFALPAPATLSGRVLTQSGGAAGARVALALDRDVRALEWQVPDPDSALVRSEVCDDEGRFDFGAVPARETLFLAAYPGPGGAAAAQPVFERSLKLQEGEVRANVTLTLAEGHTVEGLVIDAEDAPVAGVLVTVKTRTGRTWSEWQELRTDADGRFEAGPLPAGLALFTFEKDGYQRANLRLTAGAAVEPEEIRLEPALTLDGWVVDEDGYAVPGARVTAKMGGESERWSEPQGTRRSTETDEYGGFVLDDLFAGEWRLEARSTGWESFEEPAFRARVPEDSFAVLRLRPVPRLERASLRGEIAHKTTGDPVEDLAFEGLRGGAVELDGTQFRVTAMKPGRAVLIAKADGMESIFSPVELAPGVDLDLGRAEMRRAARFEVKVVDSKGRAVAGAKVQLEILSAEKGGMGRGQRVISLRKGKRGRYYHDSVPRYAWRLRVVHASKAPYSQVVELKKLVERVEVVVKSKTK